MNAIFTRESSEPSQEQIYHYFADFARMTVTFSNAGSYYYRQFIDFTRINRLMIRICLYMVL